jgi:DNA processing protein
LTERLATDPAELRVFVYALLARVHPQRLPGLLEVYSAIGQAVEHRGVEGLPPRQAGLIEQLNAAVATADLAAAIRELRRLTDDGIEFVTVIDEAYPGNLRSIRAAPPALFVQGELLPQDRLAVAVVGTRKASDRGIRLAQQMARLLSSRGVTVVSGLAAGIDTAAHEAALAAGGRTIAVMGTGHDRIYPAANRELASRIRRAGALVSQFPPGARVLPFNFANRNWVTSGISLGTVVIEADETSGARVQAQDAVKQGRFVFLVRSLVTDQPWAQRMVERDQAIAVDSVDDVMAALDRGRPPRGPAARPSEEQLTLSV